MSNTPTDINPEDQPDDEAKTELLGQNQPSDDSSPTKRLDEIDVSSDSAATEMYSSSGSGSGRISDSKGGSSGKTPGSDERVRREWEAALGSAGRGSGESIRFERQEASDSVLERVAMRKVADANIDKSQRSNFDYAIQDKLGEGGMGIVFSASQTAVNRVVALKTLKKDKNTDPGSQKQFFYEAEITADLDHPNIPPIYELGMTEQGTFFYTMKLIKGSEWHRVMSKRSQEENLEIFEKLADAVGFAHSKRIINLDIKPQNVILGGYGEVYVTDWGMAHDLDKKMSPSLGGTPDYMAPEIPRKAVDKIGPQTDIYLLGAVLFEIITGKPPHAGVESKDRKKLGQSKVLDAYHNKIRPTDSDNPLLQVALKAMSTEPADRYATVEDMQSEVREIVRENANIKTSLELTKSSKSTLQLAEKSQDYERFNRAIFGFRNAVEVWTGNKEAEEELAKARLAFGKCAFAKGDFDLALQTLDRKVPDEATLFDKAQKAKTAVQQRESRFKTLRNAVIGLLALGGIGATGAAIWINRERTEAVAQKKEAERQEGIAKANEDKAVANFNEAENQRVIAKTNEEKAVANFNEAEKQRMIAKTNEEKAVANFNEAENQRMIAKTNEEKAVANFNEASRQRGIAVEKTKEALARLAQVTVGEKLTNLGFASAQTDQANPIGAASLLDLAQQVDADTKQAFGEKPIPQLVNWASRRIELLSNKDLRPQELAGKVTSLDFAKGRNRGIAGLSDGRVVALELQDGKLIERSSKKVTDNQPIVGAAISPSGDEAMLAVGSKLYRWVLEGDLEPMQEEVTKNRSFQGFAYSPDGSMVVAGIRGGVYIKKSGADWQELTPNVKGRLLDADWLGNRGVLVLADNTDNNGERNLHFVPVPVSSAAQPGLVVRGSKFTQLGVLDASAGKLVIASDGGALTTYDFDASSNTLKNPQALTRQHRSDVTQIDIDPSAQRIVTGSGEAVVHVWKYRPNSGEVAYETFLTGTPGTSDENVIERTAMIDGNHVVNVDKSGSAVALDIDRQIQRRELTRDGNYERVVIGLHARGDSSNVLSVDENGAVDQWDLVTGKTVDLNGSNRSVAASRYRYFGHTPGAVLFDTAVDGQRGVVVTSAVLSDSAIPYAGLDGTKSWAEFCVWDQTTGNMLHRMQSEMNEPVEPRLTLLGDGAFYVGNEAKKIVLDYQGQSLADLPGEGATFAVVNPQTPSIVALCKRDGGNGQVWLWNRNDSSKPDRVFGENMMPVHAVWSNDGQRLYVLDLSGKITPFASVNGKLDKKANEIVEIKDPSLLNVLRSHQDVELVANSHAAGDSIVCNLRDLYSKQTTTLTCSFEADGQSVRRVSGPAGEARPGLFWLETHPNHRVEPDRQILSKRRAGNSVLVSMKNGRVYGLNEQGGNPILYGRQKFVMSTSDHAGDRLMLLHDDGSLHVMIVNQSADLKLATYRLEKGENRFAYWMRTTGTC
jgi:serine/threonine protein kinase/WD40 repeat protein